jgi:5-methylcytosine-specific restriction enzyme A
LACAPSTSTARTPDSSAIPQRWFEEHQPRNGLVASVYTLVRDSPEARAAAVRALVEKYFVAAPHAALLSELGLSASPAEMAFSDRAAEYRRLCERADVFWTGREDARASRTSADPIRSRAARQAVILRSRGRCENPGCTGDIQDVTDRGEPLLEVDHIQDIAKGGPDNPIQMIALCLNCHTIKTHGRTREQLRQKLLVVAECLHQELASGT